MEEYPQDQVQEVYQNNPIKSDEVYANAVQDDRIRNVISQTSPDNQLIDIEWRIKGYKKNLFSGQWEKIDPKIPEPHKLLTGRYIAFLGSILNDNTRFTNLGDSEINSVMKLCIEYLTDDMDSNAEEYGLQNYYTERTRIGLMILNSTYFVLKRAQNGMESQRIWKALNMNESLDGNAQQKKGFWDNLKFWAK